MTSTSPHAFVVRAATLDDVDRLVDLFASVVQERLWLGAEPPLDDDTQRQRFVDRIDPRSSGTSLVAVTVDDDRVVGHVGIDMAPYNVASLGMVVDAAWRGRGVGGALVEAAVDWSRKAGAHKLTLQVWPHNEAALRLYRRYGFAEEGLLRRHYRRRNGELWDAVVMGLVLDDTSPGSSLPAPTSGRPSP